MNLIQCRQKLDSLESETRDKGQGTRTKDQGTRDKDQGPRNKDQGTRNKEQGPRKEQTMRHITIFIIALTPIIATLTACDQTNDIYDKCMSAGIQSQETCLYYAYQ